MDGIDPAALAAGLSCQPAIKPDRPPGGQVPGKVDFRSMLAEENRKNSPDRQIRAKPALTEPDPVGMLPEQNEELKGAPVVHSPVGPDNLPGPEDGQCTPSGRLDSLPAGITGEPVLFSGELAGKGGEQLPAALHSSAESSPSTLEPAIGKDIAVIPGAGFPEPGTEETGKAAPRSVLLEEAPPGELLFPVQAGERPSESGPARFRISGEMEKPSLPEGLEQDTGGRADTVFLNGPGKTGAGHRSAAVGPDRKLHSAVPVLSGADPVQNPAGTEFFLPGQFPAEYLTAKEGVFTLPRSDSAPMEQGRKMSGGVLEQLRGCCTFFRETVNFPAEIRLALDPPELGEVLIRVVSREGKLSARIIAGADAVREMLAGNLQELYQRFEQNNLYLERIDLLTYGEMSQEDHRFREGNCRELWIKEGSPEVLIQEKKGLLLGQITEPLYEGTINYRA